MCNLYIKSTDPKHVITFNDNLNWFYKLKKNFEKNFISFQNGFEQKAFRELSDEKEYLSADLILHLIEALLKNLKKKLVQYSRIWIN